MKDYNGEALIECEEKIFENFFVPAELLFRKFIKDAIAKKKRVLESLMNIFFRDREKIFPCHNFDEALAKRFFTIRLHIHGKEITRIKRKRKHGAENSSKSVQSRVMAKELRLSSRSKNEKPKNVGTVKVPVKQKRFCCKYCNKSYTQSPNLKSHVKKTHK